MEGIIKRHMACLAGARIGAEYTLAFEPPNTCGGEAVGMWPEGVQEALRSIAFRLHYEWTSHDEEIALVLGYAGGGGPFLDGNAAPRMLARYREACLESGVHAWAERYFPFCLIADGGVYAVDLSDPRQRVVYLALHSGASPKNAEENVLRFGYSCTEFIRACAALGFPPLQAAHVFPFLGYQAPRYVRFNSRTREAILHRLILGLQESPSASGDTFQVAEPDDFFD